MSLSGFDWTPHLQHVASSDIGMRRANNQDSYAISMAADVEEWQEHGHLFIVADGMGAHAAGELASKLAVENVAHIYRKHPAMSPPEGLEKAIREANQEINRRGEANLEFHNMGTTCSTLLLLPQGAMAGHVGDSRVYRCRGSQLDQLTFDHSLVWEMREAGQLKSPEEESNVPKNVITRSLGPQASVNVDLEGPFPLKVGDTFLLCSDGLTGRVEDPEIATIIGNLPPEGAATLLINLANLRGGPDNITVVIIRVTSEELLQSSQAIPLTIGGNQDVQETLNPAWWIALGVCGLLALTLLAAKGGAWALAPGIAFVAVLAAILAQKMKLFGPDAVRLEGSQRLGKAPHRTYQAKSLKDFSSQMLELFLGARESADAKGWDVDWSDFERVCGQAKEAIAEGRPGDALADLVDASSSIAKVVKQQRERGIQDWPPNPRSSI